MLALGGGREQGLGRRAEVRRAVVPEHGEAGGGILRGSAATSGVPSWGPPVRRQGLEPRTVALRETDADSCMTCDAA
jgi:hypothetical protein